MEASDRVPEPKAVERESTDVTDSDATINAYSTSKDRIVFTESDNVDGWIATDLAVDIER